MEKILTILKFQLLLFVCTYVKGQDSICPTIANFSWMQANAPDRYQRFTYLENFTANYILSNGRLINPSGLIIIPVVVHVLHNGEPEGQGLNISMAQIQAQIDVINKDFRRLNDDRTNTPSSFAPVASDFNIEFQLACIDPNGNQTNGVIRKFTTKSSFRFSIQSDRTPDEVSIGVKINSTGDIAWPTDKYLNIWTCNLVNDLGYSTFPADYTTYPQFDGLVVRSSVFNSVGQQSGRTATHELGHWLNLHHLDGDDFCGDDFCSDTPAEERTYYTTGCPTYPRTAGRCNPSDPSIMFMNFMEFTNDNCMNLFTNDQRLRARAIFSQGGPRASFIDNYFGIKSPASPFGCIGIVSLSNPACLTPTWTVVSGPATITATQGTNSCTLQATGTGTVLLRATSGNYVSDVNIPVTTNPSLSGLVISGAGSVCNSQPSFFTLNLPFGASLSWSALPGGKVNLVPTNSNTVMAIPINSPSGSYALNANVTLCNSTASASKTVSFNTAPPSIHL